MTTPPKGRARPLLRAVALGSALSGCVPPSETPTEDLSLIQRIGRRASELLFGAQAPVPPPPEPNHPGNPKGSLYNDPAELTPPVEPIPEPPPPTPTLLEVAERPVYGNPKGSRYDGPPLEIRPAEPVPTPPVDPSRSPADP